MHYYVTTLIILFFFNSIISFGKNLTKEEVELYIATYAPLAIEEMRGNRIPASITLAQGIHESAAGQSRLAVEANNHFGIKCHKGWDGESILHTDDEVDECFRKYETVEESYIDHSNFLHDRVRYSSLFNLCITDYVSWANGLQQAGYATNPYYANALISLINQYNLVKYDDQALERISEESLETIFLVRKENKTIDTEENNFGFVKKNDIIKADELLKSFEGSSRIKGKNSLNGNPAIEVNVATIAALLKEHDEIIVDMRSLQKSFQFKNTKEATLFFSNITQVPVTVEKFSSSTKAREEVLKDLKDTPVFCLSEELAKPYINALPQQTEKEVVLTSGIASVTSTRKPAQIKKEHHVSNVTKHQVVRNEKQVTLASPTIPQKNTENRINATTMLGHMDTPAHLDDDEEKEMNKKIETPKVEQPPIVSMNNEEDIIPVVEKNPTTVESTATEKLMRDSAPSNPTKNVKEPEGRYNLKLLKESKRLEKKTYILTNEVPNVRYNEQVSPMSIAMTYKETAIKIMEYNDLPSKDALIPANTRIFLAPKKIKVKSGVKDHVVEKGESMWFISQQYGIQLQSLCDKNLITIGQEPQIGEVIFLKNNASKPPKLRKKS